jgi:uncharacterized protein YndB with AHSA1/START domain
MKRILSFALVTVAAAGLAVAALPNKKRVERAALINASPEAVYALLSSTAGFQKFNPYLEQDPTVEITPSGPSQGIGASFHFKGKEGEGTQTIIALEENRSVTMQLDLGAFGQPVQSFTLTPENGKTRVVWATDSEFGANPMMRVLGLMMDGFVGPSHERGLAILGRVATAQ